jgi:hypothetical protein
MPGQLYDSSNRIKAASGAGGVAPTSFGPMGTPLNAAGRICFDTSAPSGNSNHGGHKLNQANGNEFYSTSVQASDYFAQGYRRALASDALIVAVEGTVAYFNEGDPFDANGALVVTLL